VSRARATHRRGPVLVHEHQPSPFKRECQGISGHTCTNRVGTGQDSATDTTHTRPPRPGQHAWPRPHPLPPHHENHTTTTLARTRARDPAETTPPRATRHQRRPFKRPANHTTAQPHDRDPSHATHHEPARAVRLRPSFLACLPASASSPSPCMGTARRGVALARHIAPCCNRHCIGMGMGTAHHSHAHERGHAAMLLSPAMWSFERGPGREDQAPPPGVRARRERPRPPPQRVPITRARKRNPVSSRPPFRGPDRVPPGGMP
jgi:hypothetical protein